MNVLQVVHFYPPQSMGGCELYTRDLARELSRWCTVEVFCTVPESCHPPEHSPEQSICTAIRKDYATFGNPFHERDAKAEAAFAALLNRLQPDIIHVQHLMNLSLRLPLIAHKSGIPLVYTLHDFWLMCPRAFLLTADLQVCSGSSAVHCTACLESNMRLFKTSTYTNRPSALARQITKLCWNGYEKLRFMFAVRLWRRFWVKKIIHSVDFFIAPSQFLKLQYERFGIPAEKILFLTHGISSQSVPRTTTASSPPRFLFIGSLHVHKGVELLIDAFNKIDKPCTLQVYGSGPAAYVEKLRARCTTQQVLFKGQLAEHDRWGVLADSDALIVPSLCYENAPLVILEAFAAKVPVIAAGHGGMAELVHNGVNGFTFTPGSSESLARVITQCLDNPALLAQCAAGIKPVKSMGEHAQEILAVYNTLLQKKHHRRKE